MHEVPLSVDDLNSDGASYWLEQLYGLPENCISAWSVMGPALERNRVSLEYLDTQREWEASVEHDGAPEYASATNPMMAIGKVLIKKVLLENPTNSYALRLPLRTAFALGLKRDLPFMVTLLASGGVLDEEERVIVSLQAT